MRKQVFLLAIVLVLAVGLAWSGEQKGQAGTMSPAEKAAKLQEKLGLSDTQTQQVRAVFEEFQPRLEALHARAEKGEDVKAEKTKLKEEREAKLKALFTPEQWGRYQALMAEHHKQKK